MEHAPLKYLLSAMFISVAALVGCKNNEEAAVVPSIVTDPVPMPIPVPVPVPAPVPDFAVASVDLGNNVGADMKVTAPATTFAPKDTIHASVATTGVATNASVSGKWVYQDGQTAHEDTQAVTTTGPATHDFSITKPDGFPAGNYKFELWVNGALAQTREFAVQ